MFEFQKAWDQFTGPMLFFISKTKQAFDFFNL
jgi:hypothetical protein